MKNVGFLIYSLSKLMNKNLNGVKVGNVRLEDCELIYLKFYEGRRCRFLNKNWDRRSNNLGEAKVEEENVKK